MSIHDMYGAVLAPSDRVEDATAPYERGVVVGFNKSGVQVKYDFTGVDTARPAEVVKLQPGEDF